MNKIDGDYLRNCLNFVGHGDSDRAWYERDTPMGIHITATHKAFDDWQFHFTTPGNLTGEVVYLSQRIEVEAVARALGIHVQDG